MIDYLLLVSSVFLSALKSALNRQVKKATPTTFTTFRVNLVCFIFAFITVFLIGIGEISTLFTIPIGLSVLMAICVVGMQLCLMKGVQTGPVSLSSFFVCAGFIFPTAFGVLYYKDNFHFLQGIGIAILIGALLISLEKDGKKFNFKWLFYAVGAMLFAGALGILQKVFVKEYPTLSLNNFLAVVFFIVVILMALCTLISYLCQKDKTPCGLGMSKVTFCAYTLPLGAIIGGLMILNTYLLAVLPSVVAFPSINGGAIFMTALLSALIFKEKLTARKIIALCLGVGAILLIAFAQLM